MVGAGLKATMVGVAFDLGLFWLLALGANFFLWRPSLLQPFETSGPTALPTGA